MEQKYSQANEELEAVAQAVLDRLGYELVELELAGHRARPILRLRIGRQDAELDGGVTVDDCARASRELEGVLDAREDLASGYILEISSPGVERPLRKRRDFERAVGRQVALRGYGPLAHGAKRLQGSLLGVDGSGGEERVRLRLADESELEIELSAIAKANLVFDWDEIGKKQARQKRKRS